MPPLFASIAHAILHHATERPHDDAVIEAGTRISYRKLAWAIVQFTAALRALGIADGDIVAVDCRNRLVHWMILLACERIGAATATIAHMQLHEADPLFRQAAWIITDQSVPPTPQRRFHRITLGWIADTFRRPVDPSALSALAEPPPPTGIVRYTLTSGTTGEPKMLGMTGPLFLRQSLGKLRDTVADRFNHPRFLCPYSFAVRAVHCFASFCLYRGGTVIFTRDSTILADIHRHRPDLAAMLTGTAADILRAMPRDYPKPGALVVSTTGAPIGSGLRAELLRRLASEIIDIYALNETSSVAIVGADGIAIAVANTDIAIVDATLSPVPDGTPGLIKVRNDTMCQGYINDQAATAQHFRDGWFITNDVGIVLAPGKFRLLGRYDDMLNIGGVKQLPFPIEERLRSINGVRDALVFTAGKDTLAALVECADGIDSESIAPAVKATLALYSQSIAMRVVESIPRTASQKPDRRAAAARFSSAQPKP